MEQVGQPEFIRPIALVSNGIIVMHNEQWTEAKVPIIYTLFNGETRRSNKGCLFKSNIFG